ncbi:hypothetical protein TPAR_00485, partial [Tolypocladium paradoxum]
AFRASSSRCRKKDLCQTTNLPHPPPESAARPRRNHERLLPRALYPAPALAGQDGHARGQLVRRRRRLPQARPEVRRPHRGGARVHADRPQAPFRQGGLRAHLPHPPLHPVQLPAQAAAQGPVDQARGGRALPAPHHRAGRGRARRKGRPGLHVRHQEALSGRMWRREAVGGWEKAGRMRRLLAEDGSC